MPPLGDKSNAFYKDSARANLPILNINGFLPAHHRGPLLLLLATVSLVGLVALIAIAGVRFHKSTTMAKETNSLIQENIHHTDLLHHQVMDVLTPLFKIIGEEVGLRLPQRLAEIKQFILTKTSFFNPDREFDFRDLHWCINPPDRVKVNFSKFCQAIHIDNGIRLLGGIFIDQFLSHSKSDIFPGRVCPNGVTTRGEIISPALSLTSLSAKHLGLVDNIMFAMADGVYAKTYVLSHFSEGGVTETGEIRVFEIGLIRGWLGDLPVLHLTNFIHANVDSIGRHCTLAVGELKLASICTHARAIRVVRNVDSHPTSVSAISMGVFGSDYYQQSVEVIPVYDESVQQIHLSNHRGFIKDSKAYWAFPAEADTNSTRWSNCLTKVCTSRNLPFCNLTSWEPFNTTYPAVYAILVLEVSVHSDISMFIDESLGPLILNGYGMDLYSNSHEDQHWLTIPPKSGNVLGVINKLVVNGSAAVLPYILSYAASAGHEPCYAPVQHSLPSDTNTLAESNIVVLSTGKFRYVSATYDTSRSSHAIVYYIYNPTEGTSYFFPFRLTTRGIPAFLRIECFVWVEKIWCIHVYRYHSTVSKVEPVVETMVRLEFKCTSS
ncbi:hemagglutinin protein [Porcine morbillivirus]|uniref:Hemagglutinin glycoprotein n=1 Tax=Porcine morbillivirus TaxID=2846955 RepID=A0A8F1NIJ4_9MONO|nr:hemagglutinin protein [Porcine morbillivirus]